MYKNQLLLHAYSQMSLLLFSAYLLDKTQSPIAMSYLLYISMCTLESRSIGYINLEIDRMNYYYKKLSTSGFLYKNVEILLHLQTLHASATYFRIPWNLNESPSYLKYSNTEFIVAICFFWVLPIDMVSYNNLKNVVPAALYSKLVFFII